MPTATPAIWLSWIFNCFSQVVDLYCSGESPAVKPEKILQKRVRVLTTGLCAKVIAAFIFNGYYSPFY
jgi:hypothetical protein